MLFGGIALALGVWAVVGRIDETLVLRGEVTRSPLAREVLAPRTGRIVELRVLGGERVREGELLGLVDADGAESELARLDARLAALRAELPRGAAAPREASRPAGDAEGGRAQLDAEAARLRTLQAQQGDRADRLASEEEQLAARVELLAEGLGFAEAALEEARSPSEAEVLSQERETAQLLLEAATQELTAARGRSAAAAAEVEATGRALQLVEAELAETSPPADAPAGPSRQELLERVRAAERARARVRLALQREGGITSPAAGRIGSLTVALGDDVLEGELLATVEDEGQPRLVARVLPPHAARIQAGLAADIHLDRGGTRRAVVASVEGGVAEVRVAFRLADGGPSLTPGTTGAAHVVIGRRRPLSALFR
jgi:multidrug efflux pump subunit AcrA (membrane-fusion protein)